MIQGLMSIITDTDIVSHFKTRVFKPSALQSDTTFIISSGTVSKLYTDLYQNNFHMCIITVGKRFCISCVYFWLCSKASAHVNVA